MQSVFKKLWLISIVIFFFASHAQAAPENYTLDPNHTYVLWQISHFDFSKQTGKWYASGSLILDQAKPQNSKVSATIQVADMITGIKELDNHLKEKLFFDVQKFPTATFVSDKVEVTGKKTAKVHGMLTVRGITKPVVLNVVFNKADINPITNKPSVGFHADTKLNRSDFGMTALSPGLGDEVQIHIETEAYKADSKSQ